MKQNAMTGSVRLRVPNSSNQMTSDIFKTDEEHQNIKILDGSVCYFAYTLHRMKTCGKKQIFLRSTQKDDNIKKIHTQHWGRGHIEPGF